jgi:hypothetical protein
LDSLDISPSGEKSRVNPGIEGMWEPGDDDEQLSMTAEHDEQRDPAESSNPGKQGEVSRMSALSDDLERGAVNSSHTYTSSVNPAAACERSDACVDA